MRKIVGIFLVVCVLGVMAADPGQSVPTATSTPTATVPVTSNSPSVSSIQRELSVGSGDGQFIDVQKILELITEWTTEDPHPDSTALTTVFGQIRTAVQQQHDRERANEGKQIDSCHAKLPSIVRRTEELKAEVDRQYARSQKANELLMTTLNRLLTVETRLTSLVSMEAAVRLDIKRVKREISRTQKRLNHLTDKAKAVLGSISTALTTHGNSDDKHFADLNRDNFAAQIRSIRQFKSVPEDAVPAPTPKPEAPKPTAAPTPKPQEKKKSESEFGAEYSPEMGVSKFKQLTASLLEEAAGVEEIESIVQSANEHAEAAINEAADPNVGGVVHLLKTVSEQISEVIRAKIEELNRKLPVLMNVRSKLKTRLIDYRDEIKRLKTERKSLKLRKKTAKEDMRDALEKLETAHKELRSVERIDITRNIVAVCGIVITLQPMQRVSWKQQSFRAQRITYPTVSYMLTLRV